MYRILFLIISLFMLISPVMGEMQQSFSGKYKNFITFQRNSIKKEDIFSNKISFENTSPAVDEKNNTPDRLFNLTLVYTAQWGFYFVSQYSNIQNNGSFQNWRSNMFSVHFDKDSYDYNLIKHTLAGSSYYLFYRSRGYQELDSFFLTTASVLLFEFTVETVTEKPSVQDIYQTPVLGVVLGVGIDRLSNYLIRQPNYILKTMGYIINPFALFYRGDFRSRSGSYVSNEHIGYYFTIKI